MTGDGVGLLAIQSTVTLRRVHVDHATVGGLMAFDALTEVTAEEVLIEAVEPDAFGNTGRGGSTSAREPRSSSTAAPSWVRARWGPSSPTYQSTLRLVDSAVLDSDPVNSTTGQGLLVADEATLELERAVVAGAPRGVDRRPRRGQRHQHHGQRG